MFVSESCFVLPGWRSVVAAALAVPVLALAAGCGGASEAEAGGCASKAEGRNADEKYLTAEVAKLRVLPEGVCLSSVDTTELTEQPGKISVRFNLSAAASTSPEDLRPAATDLAYFLKKTPLLFIRTAAVEVSNAGYAKAPYRALLSDPAFGAHPWNGTPSRDADQARWATVPLG
ncbi:hypothetical protein [Nocardia sp. NPDC048505]|uniref:hypothetical protein n=1 Tax=unclassified Nocardia TaxID=2637762 RepID=UPI0033C6FFCF